jgi:cob(I)alamin adenosyltransferase
MGSSKLKNGYIQVYTGNGKGKTTAAIGLAIRGLGGGLKVYFSQFLKGQNSCEIAFLKNYSKGILIERSGRKSFVKKVQHSDIKEAQRSFLKVSRIIKEGKYDIIILDEIFSALSLNLINSNELITLLISKPSHVEIVLTGRNAPKKIIEIADLVTEMKEIKHYYRRGIGARRGIEK